MSDPQDPRVFVVATDFQAQAVLLVPLDPRVPQESPASPDLRETKDSKDPREALAFKASDMMGNDNENRWIFWYIIQKQLTVNSESSQGFRPFFRDFMASMFHHS